jgi:site-specific recombinase XerC
MERERISTKNNDLRERDPWDRCPGGPVIEAGAARDAEWLRPSWISSTTTIRLARTEPPPVDEFTVTPQKDQANLHPEPATSIGEFVERRFIPEHVAVKRPAGRSYFRTILNHVLPPEQVARAFAVGPESPSNKLKAIPDWPYLESVGLSEVSPEMIQHITARALEQGYSIQTATHIRNVIRVIFAHAIRTGCYTGANPANLVTLPAMTRKETHTLNLDQFKQVMHTMHYPEREIALFAILTDMSVAEICGLQWKYLNTSNTNRLVEEEFIPPKTIAVRKQTYRGQFGVVTASRRKFIRVPDVLCSILHDLKSRKQFTAPHDFVLTSRNGTPIHPENVAARRLKTIGRSLKMPWLSWRDFHRTRIMLKSEFGRKLDEEFEKILRIQK